MIDAEGALDRAKLRHIVFADDTKRHWLQRLLHPLINQYLREHLSKATSPYAILVNPLLFETQHHGWCNRTLVIDVPTALQLERTMARDNNTQEQVENIMRAQASRSDRNALADDVVNNDGALAALYEAIDAMHLNYLERASALSTK